MKTSAEEGLYLTSPDLFTGEANWKGFNVTYYNGNTQPHTSKKS